MTQDNINRCSWVKTEPSKKYHDEEWCKKIEGEDKYFEFLVLEGAQAGLSWDTVLKLRDKYKKAFFNYDVVKISKLTDEELDKIIEESGIIRNKLKVYSVRNNSLKFLEIQKKYGSFQKYIWNYSDNEVINNNIRDPKDVPNKNNLSEEISKDLKKKGFKFVGAITIYSYLQAIGMINDHENNCDFRN